MALRDLGSSVLRVVARWLQSGADWIAARAAARDARRIERPDSGSPTPGAGPASWPAGEPPAHWLERVNRGQPPAHWVERVRQGAPELLGPEARGGTPLGPPYRGEVETPLSPSHGGEVETPLGSLYGEEGLLGPGQAPPGRTEVEAGSLEGEPGPRTAGASPLQAGEQGVKRAAAAGQAGAEEPRRPRRAARLFRREPAGPVTSGTGASSPAGEQGAGRPARLRRIPEGRQDRERAVGMPGGIGAPWNGAPPLRRGEGGMGMPPPRGGGGESEGEGGIDAPWHGASPHVEEPAVPAAPVPEVPTVTHSERASALHHSPSPEAPERAPLSRARPGEHTPAGTWPAVERLASTVVSWRAAKNEPAPGVMGSPRNGGSGGIGMPPPREGGGEGGVGMPPLREGRDEGSAYAWPEPPEGHWPALAGAASPATEGLPAEEWEQRLRDWRRQQRLDREQRGLLWSEWLF
jgi:hypothetical protein